MSRNALDACSHAVSRVLLIDLGGAAYDVLVPLAASGTMPNVACLLRSATLGRLRTDGPIHRSVAWATLQSGSGPAVHGTLDECYLDHRLGRLMPGGLRPPCCTTLEQVVAAACPQEQAVHRVETGSGVRIWPKRPSSFAALCHGITRTQLALREAAAAAGRIDRSSPWRLLSVRLSVLDVLLHRLRHTLGIADTAGGNRQWVAKAREAFSTLDRCLGELLEMADRRGAAVVLVSPYGVGPFREKITVSELLRRRGLLRFAGTAGSLGSRMTRSAWKARRKLAGKSAGQPVRGLLAVDMRRSRAVSLHGQSAGLVYLNTPERFGTRVLANPRHRDQATADLLAAFCEARHPVTDEPLFDDVYLTAARFDCDPLARSWPELVAIPAAGFYTRHRRDRNCHLMRPDRSLSAARTDEGLLMVHAPHSTPGGPCSLRLTDVAPTLLALLGLKPAASMAGRAIGEWFERAEAPRERVGAADRPPEAAPATVRIR